MCQPARVMKNACSFGCQFAGAKASETEHRQEKGFFFFFKLSGLHARSRGRPEPFMRRGSLHYSLGLGGSSDSLLFFTFHDADCKYTRLSHRWIFLTQSPSHELQRRDLTG